MNITDKGNKAFYDLKWEEVGYFAEEELVRRIAGAVLSGRIDKRIKTNMPENV